MLAALHAGNMWLERNVEFVNALNVFPVPDGDTGTNMLLTFRSSLQSTDTLPKTDFGILAMTMSKAALLGARGNSGVILSQIIDGFAKEIAERKTIDGESLTFAFQKASKSELKNILDTTHEQLISTDFNHNSHSAIVDLSLTKVIEAKMAKVSAWYDNEWGFACRMCDLANYLGKI